MTKVIVSIVLLVALVTITLLIKRRKNSQHSSHTDKRISNAHAEEYNTMNPLSITRFPILNSQQQTIGYSLSNKNNHLASKSLPALINFLGHETYQRPDKLLFIYVEIDTLNDNDLNLFPKETVFVLNRFENITSTQKETMTQLRKVGFRFASHNLAGAESNSLLSFIVIDARSSESELTESLKQSRGKKLRILANNVDTFEQYTFLRSIGIATYQGFFFSKPTELKATPLSNEVSGILNLINLVSTKADPDEIEIAFKREADLTFKMLKYINSASLNLAQEVTSIKSAIVMMGYSKLTRWLSVLLAANESIQTESKDALYELGSIRGRFLELMTAEFGKNKEEQDKAFMVGMFSVMDVILDTPEETLFADLNLPADVMAALLRNEGPFSGLFCLALACELGDNDDINALSSELKVKVEIIDKAYLDAIEWFSVIESEQNA